MDVVDVVVVAVTAVLHAAHVIVKSIWQQSIQKLVQSLVDVANAAQAAMDVPVAVTVVVVRKLLN